MTDLDSLLAGHGVATPPCSSHCPPGWLAILDALLRDLVALGWDRRLAQVKEKFGGLRVYVDGRTPEMASRIAAAEEESFRTCEVCGQPGKARGGGWVLTLCETHAATRGRP